MTFSQANAEDQRLARCILNHWITITAKSKGESWRPEVYSMYVLAFDIEYRGLSLICVKGIAGHDTSRMQQLGFSVDIWLSGFYDQGH